MEEARMAVNEADFDGDRRSEVFVKSPWGIGILQWSGNTLAAPVMAQNGTRFGGWLLNTGDNRFDALGDFDGDGRDEIFVSSPWGIGVLKRAGNVMRGVMLAPTARASAAGCSTPPTTASARWATSTATAATRSSSPARGASPSSSSRATPSRRS
jgi:hypothetical protein